MKITLFASLLVGLLFTGDHEVKNFREASAETLPLSSLTNNTMDIAQGDLDGDGDTDLVLAIEFLPNVILINNGLGRFTDESRLRLPQKNHDSEDIALFDADGDKDLDILFVSEDDMVNEYYLNDGKGVFSDASEQFPVDAVTNAVVAADFDCDGDMDLVLGNAGQDLYLSNDGKGRFKDETALRLPVDQTVSQDVEAADLDGDGHLDLVFGNEDENKIYLNDGKGVFRDVTAGNLPDARGFEETRKVEISDIDQDGDLDLLFCNVRFQPGKLEANRLLVNLGRAKFSEVTATHFLGINDMQTGDGEFVDLNSDGSPDLVLANVFGGYQQVFINNGKGQLKEATEQFFKRREMSEAISLECLDLNKDGLPDLYFGVFRGEDVFYFGER